ncbi:hypothetical protein ACIBAI_01545 [Streptomyces sp. NPDC051041]|uniref:hypothetical protein n=1 Tax=Streptomyces sp. NPDC051041 TaxID=3365640 RepID=UPI0037AE513F
MDLEKRPERHEEPQGCLAAAIRVPVRIVVLVLVVPVRMVWDALAAGGRFLYGAVLTPLGRALRWAGRAVFVWPFAGLWRYVLVPAGRALARLGNVLLVVPAVWLHRHLLAPLGRGLARGTGAALAWVYTYALAPIGRASRWVLGGAARVLAGIGAVLAVLGAGGYAVAARLVRYLVVVPARWLYARVLTPLGHAVAWCAKGLVRLGSTIVAGVGTALYWIVRILVVLPVRAVWRWILVPAGRVLAVVGREARAALGHAWRIAGHLSLAVGRFLAALFRWILLEPVRWVYRGVLTPVGHLARDAVLRPAAEAVRGAGRAVRQALSAARQSVRQARADVRRTLFGEPRRGRAADRREPSAAEARTLGSSTTALTKD